MKKLLLMLTILPILAWGNLMPPDGVDVFDAPNDNGKSLFVVWKRTTNETENTFYTIFVSENPAGPFHTQGAMSAALNFKSDYKSVFGLKKENSNWHAYKLDSFIIVDGKKSKNKMIAPNTRYFIRIGVKEGKNGLLSMHPETFEVIPCGNWFAWNKLNSFILFLFLMIVILLFINIAKRNPNLFIRRIAGLEAMDDAMGRATEMGKSVLFVHGLKYIHEVPTIAAINILGRIAKRVAEFDTELKVANWDPVIQQVSRETVKESYIEAGRPDAYKEENVYFASSEQFSYAAAVEGLMVREKPAANFYFGYFYAESLLLSETGNSAGSIQIAGTDAFTQIPFFITTCDYTLIGEELYAASAYLSREPKLLGSLKGQDIGKLAIILVLIIGTLCTTFGYLGFAQIFWPM